MEEELGLQINKFEEISCDGYQIFFVGEEGLG